MNKFKSNFYNTNLQPQIFSLLLVVLILVSISIVIFIKVKKQKVDQATKGILYFAEQYAMGVNNMYNSTTNGKLKKGESYIFTLISLLLMSNLISLLGVESPTTTYSFTLILGAISWIGIFVVGIFFNKILFFKKFLNPINIIGQVAPLISISFRIFGNIIGGSTIMYLIYTFFGWIWNFIPVVGNFNFLGAIFAPVFHLYFDIFSGIIQAFVFSLLTTVYWSLSIGNATNNFQKKKKNISYSN